MIFFVLLTFLFEKSIRNEQLSRNHACKQHEHGFEILDHIDMFWLDINI